MAARGARNRIGWAVQLGTIRYLGTFLNNPEDVPAVVVAYAAEQLGLEPAAFAGYGSSEARWDPQEQIRAGYGYAKFEFDQWFALARWLYQRAWIGNERPTWLPRLSWAAVRVVGGDTAAASRYADGMRYAREDTACAAAATSTRRRDGLWRPTRPGR
ncbi:hypothetical protein GCM10022384_51020 [Streptomyces marokkonensis]|uniref:DUF4158 domain-containing protein n=1 Tax=Streptomyces marokkonensis TaxID=324855 RepID=A0ABP7RHU0_9ACTN